MKYIRTVPLLLILIISIITFGTACQSANTSQFTTTKTGSQTSTDSIPSQIGLVNDYSNVLDQTTKEHLESNLTKLKQNSDIEFAVVIVDTLGNQTLENYSMGIAQKWNFDSKDQKDGKILLLIAIKDQQWRINVTESLWKDLPDKALTELETTLTEPFGEERFGEGITKYVNAIIDKLARKRGFVVNN